jgi:phospholipid/cholesterol/gamma-HCH transport system substrate-binding protein
VITEDYELELAERLSSGVTGRKLQRDFRRARRPILLLSLTFILACATAFDIVRNVYGGSPFASRYTVQVAVSDASGVVPGTQQVRIAGVPVGLITGAKLANGQAVLTLSVRSRFGPLYRNAQLRLNPQTPLQDMYIDVVRRGTPSAGQLHANDILPAAGTDVAVQLGEVLDIFDPVTRLRMQGMIKGFANGLGSADGAQLRHAFIETAPFLRATQRLTAELAARRQMVARLVHNLGLMMSELARRDGAVRDLVASGSTTFATLGSQQPSLNELWAALPAAVRQAKSTFTTLAPTLVRARAAFAALQPVSAILPSALRSLTDFSNAAEPALARLEPAVSALAPLVHAVRPLATNLRTALAELRASAPRIDYATGTVIPCLLAVRDFFGYTSSVFAYGTEGTAFPRGEFVADAPGGYRAGASCAPGAPRK